MSDAGRIPIGWVTWPGGDPVATLFADGSWSVPDCEWMEAGLRRDYSDAYAGPQDGAFGAKALSDLARSVAGAARRVPAPKPGRAAVAAYLGTRLDDGPEVVY